MAGGLWTLTAWTGDFPILALYSIPFLTGQQVAGKSHRTPRGESAPAENSHLFDDSSPEISPNHFQICEIERNFEDMLEISYFTY